LDLQPRNAGSLVRIDLRGEINRTRPKPVVEKKARVARSRGYPARAFLLPNKRNGRLVHLSGRSPLLFLTRHLKKLRNSHPRANPSHDPKRIQSVFHSSRRTAEFIPAFIHSFIQADRGIHSGFHSFIQADRGIHSGFHSFIHLVPTLNPGTARADDGSPERRRIHPLPIQNQQTTINPSSTSGRTRID